MTTRPRMIRHSAVSLGAQGGGSIAAAAGKVRRSGRQDERPSELEPDSKLVRACQGGDTNIIDRALEYAGMGSAMCA